MDVRIRFAGESPTVTELRAVREVSEISTRWPASRLLSGLRGVREIALRQIDAGAIERLRAKGFEVEPIVEPHTAGELFELLGLPSLVEGEIRWLISPSFDPPLVLSARLDGSTSSLDLRRPRGSLFEPRYEAPDEPSDLIWHALQVDVWRMTLPHEPSLSALVAAWLATPTSTPQQGADRTSFSASRVTDGRVVHEWTWSPCREADPRGHAMASVALAACRRFTEPGATTAVATIWWRPGDDPG
jgi:hypothetical protein